MLVRSFEVHGAVPVSELARLTQRALAVLPAARREALMRDVEQATPEDRMEAAAAALELLGLPISWDRSAAYDRQIAAAQAALNTLGPDQLSAMEKLMPLTHVMLHRRAPLAYAVKGLLPVTAVDALRTGVSNRFGLDHYRAVLTDPRLRRAALNSLMLALTVTLLATPIAFALAYGINRGLVRGAGIARWAVLVPLVSPPVVIATATIMLFGRNGLLTKVLLDDGLGLIDADVTNLYGYWGVVVAQLLSFLPAAFIVFDNVLARQDPQLEEAAASQGATPDQIFRHVSLPLAQPALVRAAALVFILSLTDFGNPLVVGKNMTVLAGVLYDEMIDFSNAPLASAIAVWLIAPALTVFWLLGRIGRRKRFETPDGGRASELAPLSFARPVLTAVTWSVVLVTALVYGTIAVGSVVRVWGVDFRPTLAYFSSGGHVAGFVSEFYGVEPVWTSVEIAGVAALAGSVLAVLVAWLAERAGGWLNESITFAVLLPAVLPGAVFGIGYLVAFNAPFGDPALSFTDTRAILVLNIMFGHLYVGTLAARVALRRLDRSVDEAAEILGAGFVQRFLRVMLPMLRRATILGALYLFIDGMCTFSAVAFLQGPHIHLASIAIFLSASSAYYGVACAMSVTILAIAGGAMALAGSLERWSPGLRRIAPRPFALLANRSLG
jgi:iron(III) transport system permease protein